MKIAYDHTIFSLQEYGGISRYFCRLSETLSNEPDVQAKVFAPLYLNRYLQALPTELVVGAYLPRIPYTWKARRLINNVAAPALIKGWQPDILHDTYYSGFSPAQQGTRRVSTVYDMIHEKFANEFSDAAVVTARKKRALAEADHVICISEHTRRDLIELFSLPEEKVSAVLLGFDQLPLPVVDTPVAEALRQGKPYLLYVGLRGGYKNFSSLLRAYAASSRLRLSHRVICVGGGAFSGEERALILELGLDSEQVVQINGDDQTLALHYKYAAAFVYPSRYEGFGIPPLEAMALECPVVCSDTSSIPEVVGNAGVYFSPDDLESMRAAIESVVESESESNALRSRGQQRCALFSWEQCAWETLGVYRSLL